MKCPSLAFTVSASREKASVCLTDLSQR